MSYYISDIHEDLRKARATLRGSDPAFDLKDRARSKSYERFPQIALPKPHLHATLTETMEARSSYRTCTENKPFSLDSLGAMFLYGLGQRGEQHRTYPSGGARFPIESYLLCRIAGNENMHAYHFQPERGVLEELWKLPDGFSIRSLMSPPIDYTPCGMLIFTAVWWRNAQKYGDFSYNLSLLEAGHMGQNVALVCQALSIGTVPMKGYADGKIEELLDLDVREERPVYSLLLCPKQ